MNVDTYPKYVRKISLTVKSWWRPGTITRILEGPKPENLVVPHKPSVFPGSITAGMWTTSAMSRDVVHTPGRIEIRIDLLGFILKWRMNIQVIKMTSKGFKMYSVLWKFPFDHKKQQFTTSIPRDDYPPLWHIELPYLVSWEIAEIKVIKTKIAGVQFQYL
jgi:hypothetical protein